MDPRKVIGALTSLRETDWTTRRLAKGAYRTKRANKYNVFKDELCSIPHGPYEDGDKNSKIITATHNAVEHYLDLARNEFQFRTGHLKQLAAAIESILPQDTTPKELEDIQKHPNYRWVNDVRRGVHYSDAPELLPTDHFLSVPIGPTFEIFEELVRGKYINPDFVWRPPAVTFYHPQLVIDSLYTFFPTRWIEKVGGEHFAFEHREMDHAVTT